MKGKSVSSKKLSPTQERRASYNYRAEYFKRNPGLFGCIWFCSQCRKILVGKSAVCVDHIMPLNKGGINRTMNTVAICQECNSRKSDKVDGRVIKGYVAKLFERILFTIQKVVVVALVLVYWVITQVLKLCWKLITFPFKVITGISKVALVIVACGIIFICIKFLVGGN